MELLERVLHLKGLLKEKEFLEKKEKPLKKVIADFDSDDLQDAIEMLDGLGESSRANLFITMVVLTDREVEFKDVQIRGNPDMAVEAMCHLRPGRETGLWPKSVKTYRRVEDVLGVLFDLMCFQHRLLHINYGDETSKVMTLYVV